MVKRRQIRMPVPNFRGVIRTHIYYHLFNGDIVVGPYTEVENALVFKFKQLGYLKEGV